MIAKLFEVKETKNRGKGLFAAVFIPAGTIICFECKNCKVSSQEEISKLDEPKRSFLLEHAYKRDDGNYLIPCGYEIYLNHSCNSNILDSGLGFDIVVRDINIGEEVTYDYRQFYEDSSYELICFCNEENCSKIVRCIHPIPEELKNFWNNKIKKTLPLIKQVPQPLKQELLNNSEDFRKYLE